jgi:hypothetical protein
MMTPPSVGACEPMHRFFDLVHGFNDDIGFQKWSPNAGLLNKEIGSFLGDMKSMFNLLLANGTLLRHVGEFPV